MLSPAGPEGTRAETIVDQLRLSIQNIRKQSMVIKAMDSEFTVSVDAQSILPSSLIFPIATFGSTLIIPIATFGNIIDSNGGPGIVFIDSPGTMEWSKKLLNNSLLLASHPWQIT